MSKRNMYVLALSMLLLTCFFLFDSRGCRHTKQDINQNEMGQIGRALDQLQADTGKYPNSLKSLFKAFPNGIPQDNFTKKEYIYITDGDSFALVSLGKDHKSGGLGPDSDIVITSK